MAQALNKKATQSSFKVLPKDIQEVPLILRRIKQIFGGDVLNPEECKLALLSPELYVIVFDKKSKTKEGNLFAVPFIENVKIDAFAPSPPIVFSPGDIIRFEGNAKQLYQQYLKANHIEMPWLQ
eukprot:452026_1